MEDKSIKICMVSGSLENSGGVENMVHKLSEFLTQQAQSVTIYGFDKRNYIKKNANSNCQIIGIKPFHTLDKRRIVTLEKIAYSYKANNMIRHDNTLDIIHGHGDNCLFLAQHRSQKPLIITFHGTHARELGTPNPLTMSLIYAEKIAGNKCDMAVACSNSVKHELTHSYKINPNKVIVIHNGIDEKKFTPRDKIKARKEIGLSLNSKYVLWAGLTPMLKGLPIAIEAVKKIENTGLLVAGLSGENTSKTIFLGKLSQQKMITAYNAADLLIFPTRYEGFPLVPLEALSCGLPVIVSKESNLGEILEDGSQGFLIDKFSAECYREKIEYLLNNPSMLKHMSENCRNLALKFTWEKQGRKYLDVYKKYC